MKLQNVRADFVATCGLGKVGEWSALNISDKSI